MIAPLGFLKYFGAVINHAERRFITNAAIYSPRSNLILPKFAKEIKGF